MNAHRFPAHDSLGAREGARRSLVASVLIGIGLMAAIDEIVFHQILAWHHFYDRATPAVGLLSDGMLHAAELLLLVAGSFLFAHVLRERAVSALDAFAGFFLGMGGFQTFDGVVDHKLLRVHQIRYEVVDLWLYDTVWILSGVMLILIGAMFYAYARARRLTHPA